MENNSPQAGTGIVRCMVTCVAIVITTAAPFSVSFAQQPSKPMEFSIPAGDLAEALDHFAEQSGLQVVSDQPLLAGIKVAVLSGRYTAPDALKVLLRGTNLNYEFVDRSTVVLRRALPAAVPDANRRSDKANVKESDRSRTDEIEHE